MLLHLNSCNSFFILEDSAGLFKPPAHLRQVVPYALFQINIKYLTQSRHLQPKKSLSLAAYKKHAVLTHVDFFRLIFYHFHMPLPQTAQSLKVSLHGLVHIKM